MNKSFILVASLTLSVLLIVASLFLVSAGKPMHAKIAPVEPIPDKDQYCKDHYPSGDCTLGTYQCKDDMEDGKHVCEYVCQKQADGTNGWNFSKTCNALDGCDSDNKQCKENVAAS